ncbi:hypothetical protein [uncultured Parasphingorhabdus sp.]|uniref:hypothetical protein n=1 Tax=uncultured Parasphingorhabdus sp. TaxID=2709694 RepID=UPI0030D94267|tara:strand:- start:6173 stop:7144 length:972 start_codon:yes stop_codon:yes gene_type:complete
MRKNATVVFDSYGEEERMQRKICLTNIVPLSCLAGLAALSIPAAASAQTAHAQDRVDSIYECAQAIQVGEEQGNSYDVSSTFARGYLDRVLGQGGASKSTAKTNVTRQWLDYKAKNGERALLDHVLEAADECEAVLYEIAADDSYNSRGSVVAVAAAAAAPAAEAPDSYSVADLRYHVQETGDYAAVADYIVERYPYGKKLMEEIPEGNLLGELVVETGAKGVTRFSDAAVVALANQYYWQYNPPATRIIFAEYQRRLRVRKYTENEGKQWAARAAKDRAAQAASAASGSSSGQRTPRQKFKTCTTTTYSGVGGGTAISCKDY